MLDYFEFKSPYDCCGCRACEQICAHKAISMKEDEEGFLYPSLDESLCINCHLCEKVCPIHNAIKTLNDDGCAYATQNRRTDELMTSSSGGMFIVIAKYILNHNGVVYGAAYQDAALVKHIRVTELKDLKKIQGSKYVQSDTNETYTQVKEDLKNGRLVYFTGVPCQVAGLKLFLRRSYDNLFTSDLICHGTPSPKLFSNMVKRIEQREHLTFVNYSFRDKRIHGWSCSSSSSSYKNRFGHIVYKKYSKDMEAYFKAFISGHLMRMVCYKCPFARYERSGDITIADYWNVKETHPKFPNISKGVSLILVNTLKGEAMFKELSNSLNTVSLTKEDAFNSNWNLHQPTPLAKEREKAYLLAFNDYEGFIKKYYIGNFLINKFKVEIEYFIRLHPMLFKIVSKIKKSI